MLSYEFDVVLAANLASDIRSRFGYPAAASAGGVLLPVSVVARYRKEVMADPSLSPIGRGYYLAAVPIDARPDWMLQPARVAVARRLARAARRVRPIIRSMIVPERLKE